MGTLVYSEDLDEMQRNVAFHKGFHCMLRQKNQSSDKEMKFYEIIS